ncbi:MAG: TRAP transporter small permease [Planctomycetaceae bacterium]|nr:TRAP transporter small permease [Planctomycetaceae bacterium]
MRLVTWTQRISDAADVATKCIAVPIMGSYIFLTFAGVMARFVLKTPIMEAVIYSRLGFVWTCLLGAALAYKRMRHIRFSAIVSLLPKGLGSVEKIGINILSLGVMVWIFSYAVSVTRRVWPSRISGTDLSNGIMYIALPVALAVMILHCLYFIAEGVAEVRRGAEEEE